MNQFQLAQLCVTGSVEDIYTLHKVEIWSGVTDDSLTHLQTLKESATQLLIKYKSGALVTQKVLHCEEG